MYFALDEDVKDVLWRHKIVSWLKSSVVMSSDAHAAAVHRFSLSLNEPLSPKQGTTEYWKWVGGVVGVMSVVGLTVAFVVHRNGTTASQPSKNDPSS